VSHTDISVPANISLKQSLITYVDEHFVGKKKFKTRSEYIAHLVEKDINFGAYDRLIESFGTIYYPLLIFVIFFSFIFVSRGVTSMVFFILAGFSGVIVIMTFYLSFVRHRPLTKEKK